MAPALPAQSARPLGQGVLNQALLTIAMPKAMPRGLLGLRQATAGVTAHPWESEKIVSKIISKFVPFFDPQKTPKMLPMSLPRGSQNQLKSPKN